MIQDIITYALVALAIVFLVKKFFFTKKKNVGVALIVNVEDNLYLCPLLKKVYSNDKAQCKYQ